MTRTHFSLIKHYQFMHALEPGFQINCCVNNCPKTYSIVKSLMKHIERKHPEFSEKYLSCKQLSGGEYLSVEPEEDMEIDIPQDEPQDRQLQPIEYDFNSQIPMFLLRLREMQKVPQSSVSSIAGELKSYIELNNAQMLRNFQIAMQKHEDSGEAIDFEAILRQQNARAAGAFDRYSTTSKLKKFTDRLGTTKAVELILGHDDQGKAHTMQHVPVLGTLHDLLSHEDVLNQVLTGHKSQDGMIRDFCDGSLFAKCELFNEDGTPALQLFFYIDEFTASNPLGFRVKKYKLTSVYYTLGNLHPKYRSKLDLIQLAGLAKSMDAKSFGLQRLLDPIIAEIKILERTGITIEFENQVHTFRGTVAFYSADNLGAHDIGGFPLNFSTVLRLCRFCTVPNGHLKDYFREFFDKRTIAGYDQQAAAVEQDPDLISVYGVRGKSPLCDLSYYHVIDGLPSCVWHDIFEGVACDLFQAVILKLVDEQITTLEEFQSLVNNFAFADPDKANRPFFVGVKKFKVKFTQAKMWCFCRTFPFILGPKVPEGNKAWGVVLDLLNCLDHICSPCLSEARITYMGTLIEDFLNEYVAVFPDATIKPKHHYMVHYPDQYRKVGPLAHCGTQRFEAKHNEHKEVIYRTKNRKNICKTVADRHQTRQALIHSAPLILNAGLYKITNARVTHIRLFERNVQQLVEPLLEESEVPEGTRVKVDGVDYSIGSVVILRFQEDEYVFGLIKHIFVIDEKPMLCCDEMVINEYSQHYHAYSVSESGNVTLVKIPNLLDHHPLGLYRVQGQLLVGL